MMAAPTGSYSGLNKFIKVVIGIAVVIGFIVIFQSMYTAVMERTREIGILKSLGASKTYIVRVILRETLLLAVTGILVGYIISTIGQAGLIHRFPTLRVDSDQSEVGDLRCRDRDWRSNAGSDLSCIQGRAERSD